MMKFNKKSIIAIAIGLIALSGTSVYASGAFDNLFPEIEPQYQEQAQIVQNKLENSWETGSEKVIAQSLKSKSFTLSKNEESIKDWILVDVIRLDEKLLSSFSEDEKSSFMDAFYSEERKKNLQVGDIMPALLISPDHSEAKQFWQKSDGSYIVINLKTKELSSGHNEWYVDGNAIKIN